MMDNGISDAENERKIANAGGISEFHLKVCETEMILSPLELSETHCRL